MAVSTSTHALFFVVSELASGRRIGTFHRIKTESSIVLIEIRARTVQGKVSMQVQA